MKFAREIEVGDCVRFRLNSSKPFELKIPEHAVGTVRRKHIERASGKAWLDIDFDGQGYVFAGDPDDFTLEPGGRTEREA